MSIHGWPGTTGGVVRRVLSESDDRDSFSKKLSKGEPSLMDRISSAGTWHKYNKWYQKVLHKMIANEDDVSGKQRSKNDLSILLDGINDE